MRKLLLVSIAILCLSFMGLKGQDTQTGSLVFEEVMKIEIKLEGEMAHLMKDMPKERRVEKILYFNQEASLYTDLPSDGDEGNMEHTSGMMIMMSTPDNKLFLDLDKKELIEQREFMTRTFLINGTMPDSDWKITGAQKMVLDFPCMEATKTDTAGIVTSAWFTPAIPIQSGPSMYCNLPGMVLEVSVDDGDRTYIAKSVNFDPPAKDLLKKPKDGKKVTKEEFELIVAEKMKEMGVEGGSGSGANVMIRIKH